MDYFIEKLAAFIKSKDYSLSDLTVVLPSQRATKYLQRALYRAYDKPIFSPKIITMDRWVKELTNESIVEPTRGLFKLYQIHKKINPQEDQGLDEFMRWGRTLLSDFDEIDRYLIDYKDLFRNLTDIKELENWSFNTNETLTEAQKRFMAFWDMLPQYYVAYNELLDKEAATYMGRAYKKISTEINIAFEGENEAQFIFAGFNALSPAEKSIMKQLERLGRAAIFIDADAYYLSDHNHEAGTFLRDLQTSLGTSKIPFTRNSLLTDEKNITVINCAQSTGQAKVSATLLDETISKNELSETLLLLADERLVVPVIKNIPNTVEKSNITLGLPLKNTAVRSWVDLLFRYQENRRKFNSKAIYHKDFIRFIKHPFVMAFIAKEDQQSLGEIEATILSKNWLFIAPDKLNCSADLKRLMDHCFALWDDNYAQVTKQIRRINSILYERINQEENAIEKSVVYHFDKSLVKLQNVLIEFEPEINLNTYKGLFNQHWINETIAYYGNPLDGLQIMGLLETRLLDFKNMIVVGLNDGKMPPGNPIQTLIPMDLRRFHGLPTPREKQGLFAHHFYRLLHTAQNIWITYSSAEGSFGMDEPSRYIHQLKLEYARKNKGVNFKELFYTISDAQQDSTELTAEKSEAVIKRLDEYFEKSTSASALRTFLSCPLDFYYRYILGFGEEDKVEEDIEASTFGSFIHNTLERLYKPYAKYDANLEPRVDQNHPVSEGVIAKMITLFPTYLTEDFQSHYTMNKEVLTTGKNYLSYEIAKHLTQQFLEKERKTLKDAQGHLFIHALEAEFHRELNVTIEGSPKTIRFKGIIDRIDVWGDEVRIMDYKSGKCEQKDVVIAANRSKTDSNKDKLLATIKTKPYVFQLLIYNFLYFGKYAKYPSKTGIISLVNLKDGPFYLENKLTNDLPTLMELFEEVLETVVTEVYNTEAPFEHDSKSLYCDYCV